MELPPPGNRRVSINNPQETPGRIPTTPAVLPSQPSKISSIASKRSAYSYAYRPSIMSNRSSGPQSLLPNPILQKTSLTTPGALQSKSSNVSSVRYADEEGKPLTEKDKDKDKDKGKGKGKGAGTRLLSMLRKTLQGSQSDEMVVANQTQNLVPFGDVVGCLAIHIKSCRQFAQRFVGQQHFNLFIRVSINHIVKCTKIRHLKAVNNEKNLVLKFDEVKYFSVQVPRRQDDERNYIYLELMQDGGDSDTPPFPLGSAESHLYEVIQKGCFTEIMQLMRRNSAVCRVEVEFMFSYGNFGYGFSHQLKPLQKVIEPSMFMNIAPPPERTDPATNVITPQRVEYPAFLSPEFNVNIGGPETSQATMVQLEKLREKPRERLEKMKEEYKSMNTWIEKADYLRNLINPKMVKRESKGSNELTESNSSILEELERTAYDIHHRKSEAISNEEGRVIPVLKLLDQNYSESSLSKSGESTPPEDVLLPPIHSLQIIEEDEMPRLQKAPEPEERPREERKSIVFSSDEELMPKHPSILKISSSLQENRRKMEKSPHFSDVLIMPDKPFEELNTNKKGRPSFELRKSWERRPTDIVCSLRKVAFAQKEYTIPGCKAETTEFKPKHQFQKLTKSGLDPFLRNINSKMSFRKKKDHDDGYRHLSSLNTEILEHEDQDPPYPEHSGSAGSDTIWAENPSPFKVQMANKNSLPLDPITATIMISDRKNKLSLDSAFNSANNSNTKSIFASDNPVVSLTKLSDSDNKLLTDSSFNTTQPSNRRLSRDSNSNTAQPSDTKLCSDRSSSIAQPLDRSPGTTQPSDTKLFSDPSNNKLSRDPSSNATQLPGSNRLSHNPSINGNKSSYTSDLSKVCRDPSINSIRLSDTNKLSRDPSIISARSSDPNKLSHDPSFISTKSSDPNKLYRDPSIISHDPSIISTKSSDPNKLSHDPSINSMRLSDPSKLSRNSSIISAKSSDPNKLSRDPSIISAKSSDPNKLSRDPSIISTRSSDPNKLSRDPSITSTRLSDPNKLSRDPSIISTRSSDPNKLSRDPSITSTRLSDPNKLSRDPSIISAKSSDPNKLTHDPSIISAKSSDSNKLSRDPSISMRLSDPNKLSRDPSINSTRLSDSSKLSRDPSIISAKSSDPNKLSHDPSIISHDPSVISTKSSDPNKLSRDPSINSTRLLDPSKLSPDPSIISAKSSDPNKLSRDPSINSARSSDPNKLSHDPSFISTKSSDPNKLSRDPSIISHDPVISTKSSDPNKLSRDPSIISARSSDPNKLSHDPSFISTKSSDPNKLSRDPSIISRDPSIISTRFSDPNKLSRDPSIILTRVSDPNKLSRDPSINLTRLSDTNKLSHDPSIISTRSSDPNKLSHDPSFISTKSSDPNKLSRDPSIISHDPSIISARSSDANKLSRDPSIISAKSSDPNRLSHDPSINSTKSLDPNRLSHDPSIISAKSSDPNRLSRDPIIISAKSSDPSKLSRDLSIMSTRSSDPSKLSYYDLSFISTKSSDPSSISYDPSIISVKSSDSNRLSHDPSIIISAKSSDPNKLSRDPSIISAKSSDPNRLSHDPSIIISAKSSDANKLSRDPSIISAKSSDPNKLSHDPSIISAKSSDPNKLSRDPSIISAKCSDPNKLSHDSSIISTKFSDPNKLSHDPSIISTKLSDPSKLSRESSINARKSSDTNKLSHDPSIISTKSLDSNNRLPSGTPTVNSDTTTNTAKPPVTKNVLDPDNSTADSSDTQNKLERPPNVPLSNVQEASSVTENVNLHHPSSSINITSDIENLKQSIVLKSILSKNLQDLSDELFSKPEVYKNNESSSPAPSVLSRPSDSTDDRVFEKVQDLNSWLLSKDLLNSQVLLSPVVKSSPQDLLPEGEPGKSSNIEDQVPEKLLEAAERNFPMNRKSSFKKKHLVSEEPSSEHGLNGSIYEYVIKQIFTAPIFSQLGIGRKSSSDVQRDSEDQLLTPWERSVSSQILNYEDKGNEVHLSQSKSVISQIIQSFPVNTLLESGIIKVIELDKEHQNSLLDSQTTSSTEQYSDIRSQIKLLSRQNTSSINPLTSSVSGAEYTEDCQSVSTQESKYPVPDGQSDSTTEHQSLDTEETELSSNVESSSSSLDKVKDTDTAVLKSVLKNIFSIFFKYNLPERRQQPEKESESLIKHSSSSGTEHLEKIQENVNKTEKKVDRKPILNPKLRVFLEKLSETEVKNLKSELSKHIQHYLVERLTESGHITKEDLPTIYNKLYLMNEKSELKEPSSFQEKYSETVKEIMSFVNNFNHHFIDKHLETKLRAFLSEILQNYFLKNLSVSNLFNESDTVALHASMSPDTVALHASMSPDAVALHASMSPDSVALHASMSTDTVALHAGMSTDSVALHAGMSPVRSQTELGQDISSGNFGSSLKVNMKYPVSKSLQNYLQDLSENELLSLKTDLSKYLQVLFIEKLYKSGLVSERQLKGISQEIISLQSPPIPLKHIKTNLPFRNESYFMREDSEEQMKYSKNGQNAALQTLLKDNCEETELARKEERESSFSQNLKENLPTIWEQKTIYTREEETLNLIQMHSSLNKNNQANSLTRSPERPSDISLKKQKKDHGFMQFTQVESSVYKTESQDPYSWDSRSKTIQSKPCFEKILKMKQLDKRENNNIYKLTAQEKLDTEFSPYLKLPNCKISKENESVSRLSFPTWQTNTFINVKPEIGEQSKLDHYYQRLKGNNNNNKKHLVTFAQFKNEMETLYRNPYEVCNEKRASISESQSFKYKENEKNSRPFFFPEVLKRENMKSKRKERDHATKPKKSFHKIVRLLPATLPTTRPHLRKSVPRSLLHWTARRTIHDCLDRFDDLHVPSVKCPKKSKSRARFLGKSPDDSHNQARHCARPYTAPEPNKRRESAAWKFASPRMVSAGLVHLYATPEYEIRKMRSKRKLKEDIEKRPLISEIIQMLDTAE